MMILVMVVTACQSKQEGNFAIGVSRDPHCTAFADGKLNAYKKAYEQKNNSLSILRRKGYWLESYRQCMDLQQPVDYCKIVADNELEAQIHNMPDRGVSIPQWRINQLYQRSYSNCKQNFSLENYCSNAAGGRLYRYEEDIHLSGRSLFLERRQQVFKEFYSQCLETFGQSTLPVFYDSIGSRYFNENERFPNHKQSMDGE